MEYERGRDKKQQTPNYSITDGEMTRVFNMCVNVFDIIMCTQMSLKFNSTAFCVLKARFIFLF